MAKLERDYQKRLIKTIESEFPDALVLKNDPTFKQGIPDLVVLNHGRFAFLEVKRAGDSSHRPNQDYYIQRTNDQDGFGRFVEPGNQSEVLSDLHSYFEKE